ncbi:MAG TPA: prepilin-type N-terminal cleavage/methylation domain-containing protein [Candidatus Saccharimonadales bacterium]|nr:prepilin-type N-terminal cleavage/methylation domain-containing protein [Candidatus Saccharimonadales bacterium]
MSVKTRLSLGSRGDTIVEVMVTLAILGLAFSIAYATANHSLMLARNSEEHSEATQFLQSQVEQIRAYIAQDSANLTSLESYWSGGGGGHVDFCFDAGGTVQASHLAPGDTDNPDCTFGNPSLYQVAVQYVTIPEGTQPSGSDQNQSYFKGVVSWDGVGQLGKQQVQFNYRIF